MIKNKHQLGVSQSAIERLESEIALVLTSNADDTPSSLQGLQLVALRSQLDDISAEVTDYLALAENPPTVLKATSLLALPDMLISSRIALGLTQEALGALIGVHKQTIQRYEDTDYASASFDRIAEIASALNVDVSHQWQLPDEAAS